MTPEPFDDETTGMLYALLGEKLVHAIFASSYVGHHKVSSTARVYMHTEHPPSDDNAAAVAVVVDLLRDQMSADELVARHPWLHCVNRSRQKLAALPGGTS